MKSNVHKLAEQLLHKDFELLNPREQNVINRIADGVHISRNVQKEHQEKLTPGQKLADRVASFGGSWPFIILFMAVLVAWIAINSLILARWNRTFDPYPYILLNLVLSMLAAIQAPVIMMSQNRHAEKDRIDAAHDYEVNLKAELEIMSLHQKLDVLRQEQWSELLAVQQDQTQILTRLMQDVGVLKNGGGEVVLKASGKGAL
ncbi:MAG: DUF1003 domain-containing protein [Syntrophobacteraceae bacterium]|nr:DUF1003 domain-containing protein [Syntrophobacteraceae bacterium]